MDLFGASNDFVNLDEASKDSSSPDPIPAITVNNNDLGKPNEKPYEKPSEKDESNSSSTFDVFYKVQALYDFEGQSDTGELSITSGEVLTITRTDVGEGWWEGTNSKGESGLFPEAYVEKIEDDEDGAPPSMAPPPLPVDYRAGSAGGWAATGASTTTPMAPATTTTTTAANNDDDDDWGNAAWGVGTTASSAANNQGSTNNAANDEYPYAASDFQASSTNNNNKSTPSNVNQGYDQDEWDSDFDDNSENPSSGGNHFVQPPNPSAVSTSSGGGGNLGVPKNSFMGGSTGDLSSGGKKNSVPSRSSFNRFSTFVKSGSENYVLGKCNVQVQESDYINVIDSGGGDNRYSWLNTNPPYNCAIASPKKESKLHGLKSYIAYQLTPSFSGIQVPRRYKHFDWLHERLVEKFTLIPIPPLPDKQIQGRYEEEFIEHRMNQLQSFVDRICRHPVLSQSEVWQHFLTCTDDKRWKTGKRKAEKDALVGGNFFMTIRTPDKALDGESLERQIEIFTRFSTQFDGAVKNMLKTCAEQTQKCQTHYKREFQNIGKSFTTIAAAMDQDPGTYSVNLNNAVRCTGEMYEDIAKMYDDQPRNDWEPLGDMMHDYRGLLSCWPGILQIHSGAMGKKNEFDKMAQEGKINKNECQEISQRTDILSYGILAEINNFHNTRTSDIKKAHQNFLQQQIVFYQKITEKLQESLRMFDNC